MFIVECGVSYVLIGEYGSLNEAVAAAREGIRGPGGYCVVWLENERVARIGEDFTWVAARFMYSP